MGMPIQLQRAQRIKRRRGSSPRTVLEELPAIDARWLARKKLFPRDHSTRRYSFDFINPAIRGLVLSPRCAEITLASGQTQLVPVVWLRICGVWQAARPAFQCPGCGRNAFKLFYRHGRFAGCYRCIGVPYASQQRSTKNRPRLQAARLKVFLGDLPGSTGTPRKPTWMHRRTYARLVGRLHRLEANSARKQQPIAKRLSHKVWRPNTAYDSQRYGFD
jgi:hypothetical protein